MKYSGVRQRIAKILYIYTIHESILSPIQPRADSVIVSHVPSCPAPNSQDVISGPLTKTPSTVFIPFKSFKFNTGELHIYCSVRVCLQATDPLCLPVSELWKRNLASWYLVYYEIAPASSVWFVNGNVENAGMRKQHSRGYDVSWIRLTCAQHYFSAVI